MLENNLSFFNTLFGSLNYFWQNVSDLVPKNNYLERKKEKNYISEIRYLKSPRLKQDSLDIDRKETDKSLKDLVMDVLILMLLYGLSLKISLVDICY